MRHSDRTLILTLALGLTIGFYFSYFYHVISSDQTKTSHSKLRPFDSRPDHGMHRDAHNEEEMENAAGPEQDAGGHQDTEDTHIGEDTLAREMYQNVRVLCWVMTSPTNHQRKAKHVKKTWGKRCNVLLFMSSEADNELPAIGLPVGEGRQNLWGKTKEAFRYVWEKYKDDVDWFMKADDDTYVIVENLRYMLSGFNSSDPLWFGSKFKHFSKQGYFSGGAGYVLSKEALRRFVETGLQNPTACRPDSAGAEDAEMGKCMDKLNVLAMDSRDHYGRGRFFPFHPSHHLIPGHATKEFWYWTYIFYPVKEGFECCSDTAIAFHYISPNDMYLFEYLIYHLRPFGISNSLHGKPLPPPDVDLKATPWPGPSEEDEKIKKAEEEKKKEEEARLKAKEEEIKKKVEEEEKKRAKP